MRLEVLGHTGIEIGIRRPPDELEGNIQRFHLGKTRCVPLAKEDEILPILDRWAKLIPQVKT